MISLPGLTTFPHQRFSNESGLIYLAETQVSMHVSTVMLGASLSYTDNMLEAKHPSIAKVLCDESIKTQRRPFHLPSLSPTSPFKPSAYSSFNPLQLRHLHRIRKRSMRTPTTSSRSYKSRVLVHPGGSRSLIGVQGTKEVTQVRCWDEERGKERGKERGWLGVDMATRQHRPIGKVARQRPTLSTQSPQSSSRELKIYDKLKAL